MLERGLVGSRSQVQRLIMAGQVRVDGQVVLKPSAQVFPESEITIETGQKYVSRGGEKLEGALNHFNLLDLEGMVCADVGASTGGFSDCLLQHGASHVYAIDVGHHILHWKIRNDERVIVMEGTNARFIESLDEKIDLATIDVSFISLQVILPVVKRWLKEDTGAIIALIKPQFEAGKKEAARGKGVIRDPLVHREVLIRVLTFAQSEGFQVQGIIYSPLLGPKGNVEFLTFLSLRILTQQDIPSLVDDLLADEMKTQLE